MVCPSWACTTSRGTWLGRAGGRPELARPSSASWSPADTRRSTGSLRRGHQAGAAGSDPGRRRGRGLRQGRQAAGSAVPGRSGGRGRGRSRAIPRAVAFPRPMADASGLRLLLQRPQDRRGAGGRAPRGRARPSATSRTSRPRSRRPPRMAPLVARSAPGRRAPGRAGPALAVVGGVAANRLLREEMQLRRLGATASERSCSRRPSLCTDNAVDDRRRRRPGCWCGARRMAST